MAAGLTVALVLIPQALAYAELAGVPRERGLFAAIAATIAASFLASSRVLQTGPVALTALLTLGALVPLAAKGSDEYAALAVLLALVVGAVRLLIGLLRFGRVSYLMSQPMMTGFTAAAGILIIASQLPAVVGVAVQGEGVLGGAVAALSDPGAWSLSSLALAGGAVALILGMRRVSRRVPAVLIVTVVGLLIGAYTSFDGAVVGRLPIAMPSLPPDVPWSALPALVLPGVVIALVGFAEVGAISRLYAARERVLWDPDREFVSQGAANVAAGLASGFPVGGSFSRTSLNYLSGAVTRRSGLLTGLFVLAFMPFAAVLEPLPIAVLAAVVIASVVSLVDLPELVDTYRQSRGQGIVAWTTFGLTLALAPRIDQAMVLGVLVSVAVHLFREMSLTMPADYDGETLTLAPKGVLWFGSAPELERLALRAIAEHADAKRLVIDARGLGRLDFTAAQVVRRIVEEAEEAGLAHEIRGVIPQAQKTLGRVMKRSGNGGVNGT